MKPRSLLATILLIACLCGAGALRQTAFAQKASVPKQPNPIAIAREKVKELLAVMETDKNGKISKQQWIKFMEVEFDSSTRRRKVKSTRRNCCARPLLTYRFVRPTWASKVLPGRSYQQNTPQPDLPPNPSQLAATPSSLWKCSATRATRGALAPHRFSLALARRHAW